MIQDKSRTHLIELFPGLFVTLIIAGLSFLTWLLLKNTFLKFSALLWSFVFSIIIGNIRPSFFQGNCGPGIELSATKLLRCSIAMLGLTVNATVWLKVGGIGISMILLNLFAIFILSVLFCKYALKLDDPLTLLIAAGTGICGASAIAAVGPAIRAKAEEMGLAVATVTLFGLLAMFVYPLLFNGWLGNWLGHNPLAYGMWAGTGIHETAQVIAAASQIKTALPIATSAKFIRIFMIGPLVLICLLMYRSSAKKDAAMRLSGAIPWFAILFVIFSLLNTLFASVLKNGYWTLFTSGWVSPGVTFFLAWSFAGIGLKVKMSTIRKLGVKAFVGGMVVAVAAGVISLLLVKYLWLPSLGGRPIG